MAFTLVEMLMVVGIVTVLMLVVFMAVNPQKRMIDSRNTRRMGDVDTILIAVHQYVNDSGGSLPDGVGSSFSQIGTCTTGGMTLCVGATTRCVDIGATLNSNKYIKNNPIDPKGGVVATTGYAISKDANNFFTVKACLAEGTTISKTQ